MMTLKDQYKKDQHSYHNRQKALDSLQETCEQEDICEACAASAAAYLYAISAKKLDWTKAKLVEFCAQVWDDLEKQRIEDGKDN